MWSPDGRHIAFTAVTRLGQGELISFYRSALYVVSPDGSDLQLLSARPGTQLGSIAWSPDSRLLAFAGVAGGSRVPAAGLAQGLPEEDVFVIRADGTGETNVTNSADDETGQAWSPDGSRLAFIRTTGRTGRSLVSVESPAVALRAQIQLSQARSISGGVASPGRRTAPCSLLTHRKEPCR